MKIEYIKLNNFANIYTAMNTKEISIDFGKCKNKIILLTGANGSGKTSLLSCLHPFATNSNMDVRNDNSLVMSGKDGYKEIHIVDDGNLYVIKHYYTAKKDSSSHSVKSYIERNGVELNPNGNVTSFNETVRTELEIELDYLKLTRLGGNVTNFIDLKTVDRKSFMGKILNDVDIYLKYFKKITTDMREIKSVISHLVDKLNKLNITDEDEINDTQKQLKKMIDKYKDKISEYKSSLSIIDYEISKYDSPIMVKESIDIKKKELDKIYRALSKKTDDIDVEFCNNIISNLEKEIFINTKEKDSLIDKRTDNIDNLDKLIHEQKDILQELSKVNESTDITDTEYVIDKLRETINTRSHEYNLVNYDYKFTKDELDELIIMLDKSMDILYSTYEFGKEPIKKAISFILSNSNVNDYVSGYRTSMNKNKLQAACVYVYNEISKKLGIVKPNCNNSMSCGVSEFYNTIFDYATEEPDVIDEDETFVTYTKMANQNINTVIKNIQSEKKIFDKLPSDVQEMFTLKNLLNNIENLSSIYDRKRIYELLSIVSEYELQQNDLAKLNDAKEKLALLKKSIGNTDYLEKRNNTILNEIDDMKSSIYEIGDNIDSLNETIKDLTESLIDYKELYESIINKDKIESEYSTLKDDYSKLKELYEKKSDISKELSILEFDFSKLEKDYNNNEYRLQSFISLNKELTEYRDIYDDMELIKNSLSSKEGIPLLYIQSYLKNIKDMTNELLEVIYSDNLYVDDFIITADEFKIPYVTNSTNIADVSYASQGEKSFISLSLSFAIIYQSISRYNIMLLDEIDATLDTKNREKFLQILEKQMDMIDSEQIFVISHNNMFNMYPVDIIDTSNTVNADNRLANYIKIQK